MNPSKYRSMRLSLVYALLLLLTGGPLFTACHYTRPDLEDEAMDPHTHDSLVYLYARHYTWNTNLELREDSISIAYLPVKERYCTLYKGDKVVVAEFAVHPEDSRDTVWVKLAHSQEEQGWISERELLRAFVPTDAISQTIYFFTHTRVPYYILFFGFVAAAACFMVVRRRRLPLGFFTDDSLYPLCLCLLVSLVATCYKTMQHFRPDLWLHFYFNPTLSPFHVPFVVSLFLANLWLFIVVLLATLDDLFRRLPPVEALSRLPALASGCILCYFFFLLTIPIYIGYAALALFVWVFLKRLYAALFLARYRCGRCGYRLRAKGVCPRCGAVNE